MHCNKNPYMLSRVFTKVITAPFSPNFAPKILAKLVKVTCRSARERAMRYPFSHNHGSVENGDLEDDWLVSFWGPFSTEPWLWEEGYVCVCVSFSLNQPKSLHSITTCSLHGSRTTNLKEKLLHHALSGEQLKRFDFLEAIGWITSPVICQKYSYYQIYIQYYIGHINIS